MYQLIWIVFMYPISHKMMNVAITLESINYKMVVYVRLEILEGFVALFLFEFT